MIPPTPPPTTYLRNVTEEPESIEVAVLAFAFLGIILILMIMVIYSFKVICTNVIKKYKQRKTLNEFMQRDSMDVHEKPISL